jgi:NADH dehydrogenase
MLGRPVAERLRADGCAVRVLARDPERARTSLGDGYQLVEGDVGDPASLPRAVEGCHGVHISLKAGPQKGAPEHVEHTGTARVADAAAKAGVQRITYLSGCFVDPAHAHASEAEGAKWRAEQALGASGVPFTILKPTYFMETLANHVQGKVAVVLGRQPHRWRMVAADDFARMVSSAHRNETAGSGKYPVFGPEPLTIPEALKRYCDAIEGGKRVVTAPLPVMKALNATVMRGELNRELALMAVMGREGEPELTPEGDGDLPQPTTTLSQWLERLRASKRPEEA